MKPSVFLVAALFVGLCSADFSKQELKGILAGARGCVSQLSIGPNASDFVQSIMYNRDMKDDLTTKQYIKCVMQAMGLMDAEGNILTQVIVEYFRDNYDEKLLVKLMNTCGKPEGATIEDKAYNFYTCAFANKEFDL